MKFGKIALPLLMVTRMEEKHKKRKATPKKP